MEKKAVYRGDCFLDRKKQKAPRPFLDSIVTAVLRKCFDACFRCRAAAWLCETPRPAFLVQSGRLVQEMGVTADVFSPEFYR